MEKVNNVQMDIFYHSILNKKERVNNVQMDIFYNSKLNKKINIDNYRLKNILLLLLETQNGTLAVLKEPNTYP